MRTMLVFSALVLTACPGPMALPDGGGPDAGAPDAGLNDAGSTDAGALMDGGWIALFNGSDLSGWDSWLGSATGSPPAPGLNMDTTGIFSVATIDGEAAIHITGTIWGALISQAEYGNFELEGEYRWGPGISGPAGRDSGLMYFSTGAYGAVNAGGDTLSNPIGSGSFMVCMEYQLTHTDPGGAPALGPVRNTVTFRDARVDSLTSWNTIRMVVRDTSAEHWLNGVRVTTVTGFTLAMPGETPRALTSGKLQLQSEGGEIYFRRLRLRPL
jgi:hypothetical protein